MIDDDFLEKSIYSEKYYAENSCFFMLIETRILISKHVMLF